MIRPISSLVFAFAVNASSTTLPPEHRDPTLKAKLCAEHGMTRQECENFEADHIIPLCLRLPGLDVLSNMQLQACDEWRRGPRSVPICVAGLAYRKDLVERRVCREVERGLMTPEEGAKVFTDHEEPGGW
jgi:hypothetical protein